MSTRGVHLWMRGMVSSGCRLQATPHAGPTGPSQPSPLPTWKRMGV